MVAYGRSTAVTVPFLDLRPSHAPIREHVLAEIAALIDDGRFVNGPAVADFELDFAAACGTRHAVGVASGLDALRLALIGAGVGPGDEVVVPASTFIATFEAVTQAGARPVPVDVSELDYTLDAAKVRAAVSERTRVIMPVHLYGQLSDMRALSALAAETSVPIIEDACQAHGATRDGVDSGRLSLAAAFSFYPGKNLGAFGDAGALVTNDDALADSVRALREHGQSRKYHHDAIGYTSRLDSIQAIALRAKLPYLDSWNEERRAAAAYYAEHLQGVGDLRLPATAPGSQPVWHLYVVRTSDPDELAEFLRAYAIGTGRHYPQPVHVSAAYRHLGYREGSFPVTEALAKEALSLPMFPGIEERQLAAVVTAIRRFFDGA